MEHSALHAFILTGMVLALGGAVAALFLLLPLDGTLGTRPDGASVLQFMTQSAAKWVTYGALVAALATLADFFVGVAEIQGTTVFGGIDLGVVWRFATETAVGRLNLVRLGLLLLTACATMLPGKRKWWLVLALGAGTVFVASLVSHAAAQPEHRVTTILTQFAHVSAAAVWMGVLFHLFIARRQMLAPVTDYRVALVAEIVRRFSPVALTATLLLGFTGLVAICRYSNDIGALFTSAYGLTLLVKLGVLAPAIFAGFVNFRFIRPQLLALAPRQTNHGPPDAVPFTAAEPDASKVLHRFGRMLELEVTAGVLVLTVAGILGSISPPGEEGSQRLTATQVRALFSPHLPFTAIQSWPQGDDSAEPTIADFQYSEFTHNCSGLAVSLIGLTWIAQGVQGAIGCWARRLSFLPLVALGLFVGLAADPELWLLHRISFGQALTDPFILEHQSAAVAVFVLAWLTWREDQKGLESPGPLTYGLPLVMIAGSLLLLGHAHATSFVPEELTNLINFQHAIMGGLGLFGSTARWLTLRGLVRTSLVRFAWPGCILGIGLFMSFFYREVM